jgi:HK97 family phage major capsid protein
LKEGSNHESPRTTGSPRQCRRRNARAVRSADTEKRDLTNDEDKKFATLKTEISDLDKKIGRATTLAEAERRSPGEPVSNGDRHFETECRSYSLVRAMAAQAGLDVDAGREREISRELARRSGRSPEGIFAPTQVFHIEQRVMTPSAGGVGITPVDPRPEAYIDILRAAIVIRKLGATVLSDLVGNAEIGRLATSATVGWVADNSALTPSDQVHEKVTLTPKHAGGIVEFSRNMLLQSSPDIEQLVRRDFAQVLAAAIDSAAINGGGSNMPVGILATSGIGDVPGGANGLAPSYANLSALIASVATANALGANMAFLTNSKVAAKLRTTLKSTTDTSSNFIITERDTLLGYPLAETNLVPSNLVKGTSGTTCSALIFGNFSDLLLGYWSELDILTNPFESAAFSKGNVQVRAMSTVDVALRHPQSFAATKDLLTT